MYNFYLIAIVVAIIILIILLTVIGIMIKSQNQKMAYPPTYSSCPDYWTIDGSNCMVPTGENAINNGYPSTVSDWTTTNGYVKNSNGNTEINFNDPSWLKNGQTAVCNQKAWANTNGILWSGVSNYNGC